MPLTPAGGFKEVNMSPTDRIIFCLASTSVGCLVPLLSVANKANEQWSVRQELQQTETLSAISEQSALGRARYCLQLNPKTPISNGVTVTYPRSDRLLPAGQIVCDQYGNTALVDGSGRAIDIQTAPSEKLNKILKERYEKRAD